MSVLTGKSRLTHCAVENGPSNAHRAQEQKTQVSEEQLMSDRLLMRASSIKMCVFADVLYN